MDNSDYAQITNLGESDLKALLLASILKEARNSEPGLSQADTNDQVSVPLSEEEKVIVKNTVHDFNTVYQEGGVIGVNAKRDECYKSQGEEKNRALVIQCIAFDAISTLAVSAVETSNRYPTSVGFLAEDYSRRANQGALKLYSDEKQRALLIHDILIAVKKEAIASDGPVDPNEASPLKKEDVAKCTFLDAGIPCQFEGMIDKGDWSFIRSAVIFTIQNTFATSVQWKNSSNDHSGMVRNLGKSNDPACSTYQVTLKNGRVPRSSILVCKNQDGNIEIK